MPSFCLGVVSGEVRTCTTNIMVSRSMSFRFLATELSREAAAMAGDTESSTGSEDEKTRGMAVT